MSDEPMKHAVSDDPAHPEISASHGEPTPDTVELLADIGSQCRFMGAILKDIQTQLGRIERGVRQEHYPNQSQEQSISGLKAQQDNFNRP
jgi:pseudouridine-5'-phosphate glycosidase